ncbi:MAG: HAD family phosphatase [Actinomycetota bacterium]
MAQIEVVVFDMGGVLVRLSPLTDMLAGIADTGETDEELARRFILAPAVRRFERGQSEIDDFANELIAEMDLPVRPAEVVERMLAFPKGLFPGAIDLVASVQAAGVLAAVLSNTNRLHWGRQTDHAEIRAMFDRSYLSFQLGMVKPDPEIYEHVVADLGVPADRVLFIDDNQINVDGARAVGLAAEVARGREEAEAIIRSYGVI